MDQDPATQGLDPKGGFNYVRDTANAIQAGIYGNNPPARTIIGTTFIVLNDVFEFESTWLLTAQPQPQCVPERRCC
nr:hypothetical protein Cbor_379 [Cedratvirus borely]